MSGNENVALPVFVSRQRVRFAHCDAAGIIFYPRALELLNAAQEDWFREGLGWDYCDMHIDDRRGIPTVELHCVFDAPLLLGDEVDFGIHIQQAGGASLHLRVEAHVHGARRMTFRPVLVCMDLGTRRSTPWPAALATRFSQLLAENGNAVDASHALEGSEIS